MPYATIHLCFLRWLLKQQEQEPQYFSQSCKPTDRASRADSIRLGANYSFRYLNQYNCKTGINCLFNISLIMLLWPCFTLSLWGYGVCCWKGLHSRVLLKCHFFEGITLNFEMGLAPGFQSICCRGSSWSRNYVHQDCFYPFSDCVSQAHALFTCRDLFKPTRSGISSLAWPH